MNLLVAQIDWWEPFASPVAGRIILVGALTNLACALVGRPEVLVLDEPTVGLDPVLRVELWSRFADLAAAGTTLLVSSHVMDEAARCDRLLLLREGELLADSTPDRLRAESGTADLDEAFLRVVRARDPQESATVFLPAVRPLLALAATMEEQRNHVMPPPKRTEDDLESLDLDVPEKEPREGELQKWEALEADARFAHVLHGGTAHTGDSRIVDPQGELLGTAADTETMLLADLSAQHVSNTRARFPFLQDRRRTADPLLH